MTTKELATLLNNIEYTQLNGGEASRLLLQKAKENDLVVVFGASDDLIEFRGAIEDEGDCFDGDDVYITKDGVCTNEAVSPNMITAVWCGRKDDIGNYISWTYKTDISHEVFNVTDDGEIYCEGIVFSLNALK